MKPSVLFLSNSIYFDKTKNEGGVKLCTEEYRALLEQLYKVIIFPVDYHINFQYRLRSRLGLNIYNDYKPSLYIAALKEVIRTHQIEYVFLNLSNTMVFAPVIKDLFGEKVKIIICSHGNESGDFLHEATRFRKRIPFYKTFLSSYSLGRMLKKEAAFRQNHIDAVLTVSPIEEALENWIGAKQVFMVPRTVLPERLKRDAIEGRVGFMGDLSHWPNFYGIDELCKAFSAIAADSSIEVRIVGAPAEVGMELAKNYSFVTYLGYLTKEELKIEASSWAFFLNPVFYYSRGVSTKLAKALGWGLPVITTSIGHRGYQWNKGRLVIAETPAEMASKIRELSTDRIQMKAADDDVNELISSMPTLETISKDLHKLTEKLS